MFLEKPFSNWKPDFQSSFSKITTPSLCTHIHGDEATFTRARVCVCENERVSLLINDDDADDEFRFMSNHNQFRNADDSTPRPKQQLKKKFQTIRWKFSKKLCRTFEQLFLLWIGTPIIIIIQHNTSDIHHVSF